MITAFVMNIILASTVSVIDNVTSSTITVIVSVIVFDVITVAITLTPTFKVGLHEATFLTCNAMLTLRKIASFCEMSGESDFFATPRLTH